MDKDTRSAIERATQRARKILEDDFAAQLEGDFDVHHDGAMAAKAGGHLSARQAFQRDRIVATIEHKRAAGMSAPDSVADYLRDAAFTTLNRFVALKMLEARELVQECITKGEQSKGYCEFYGMAPGLPLLPDSAGYRLYIESLFDELSTEVKVLFDRRDSSSVLWPKRATFEKLLEILNAPELAKVWSQDETIGWVFQFFNGQDERRKMREESQAPRNSRELAVRNQFFTPRYVVQFLTDNTLGRIWFEMRGTNTALAEKCEYMVRKPGEEFAPRAKKDPRDLRVLDPACGSGHFLLYAFDLLLTIYEEAHADPESPKSEATSKTLAEDYPSLDALRKAVPRLVLAHNLHGVDIDPRCAQIAQLALWMRAQKAYHYFGIGRAERAQIRRSNIVVAEPLVADEKLAREFVAKLGDVELGRVFTALVDSLNLAGDMGLLLRVEQLVARQSGELFAPPEERIRSALDRFARKEAGSTNTRRRLFVDDAARAVGLLSIAEQTFDAVLMNPPFGDGSMRAKRELESGYPRTKNDIFAAFVERGIELMDTRGLLGAITSRTGFFLTSFKKWREDIVLSSAPPLVFADLGLGVMDAALVEAAAYCLEKKTANARGSSPTIFFRALEEVHHKDRVLRSAIHEPELHVGKERFEVAVEEFRGVPGSPFAYWVSPEMRAVFGRLPAFESHGRAARQGLATADDFRFVRLWWEVPTSKNGTWFPYAKGGKHSPFYFDLHLVVNWQKDGRQIVTLCKPGSERPASRPQNTGYFFRAGLTWPRRTKSELSFRVMPAGCVFGDKGPAAFVEGDDTNVLLSILAITTSSTFRALVEFQLAAAEPTGRGGVARSYEVGVIQRTPLPILSSEQVLELAQLARRAWSLKRCLDAGIETSHAFVRPNSSGAVTVTEVEKELDTLRGTIDRRVSEFYGLPTADARAVGAPALSDVIEPSDEAEGDEDDDDVDADPTVLTNIAMWSWLVGCAFGRFDSQADARESATEPEPFDELPCFAPGMVPSTVSANSVLVDDEGHAGDLVTKVLEHAERISVPIRDELRGWLAKEFFPLHIRMYSKSRRKAPIYWQLATSSASYSVWLYVHAFSKDTLFRVQNDYAAPKLAHEERRLESLTGERDGGTAVQRKAVAAQGAFVEELRAFLDEVKRVAPLWNPNLDDGVIINFAPLWRLVPQNKAWQKELKATWDALCEGKYDWAHLAMHLWPERVVPKCAKDRSLAIAHGFEDVFWAEDAQGKWTARKTPTCSIAELVSERTSPAVKSALKSLLEAPAPSGKSLGRGRGGRGKAAAEGGDA